jgi:Flp pilus assembly protein TadG
MNQRSVCEPDRSAYVPGVNAEACVRVAARAPAASAPAHAPRNAGRRGQSVTEFALVLPVMLAFLGLTLDFARVFQAWITLESATRDAAEAAATSSSTSAEALDLAQRTICLQAQNIPGYTRSGSPSPDDVELCAAPAVSVVAFSVSTTAPGASDRYPVGSATVEAQMPFRPFLAYPFITQDGAWTIITRASFSIIQGRE